MQDTVDEMNKMLTSKVAGLTADVASLNDSLSTEKLERIAADDNLNTKLLAQCEKVRRNCCEMLGGAVCRARTRQNSQANSAVQVREALAREMQQRADEANAQHRNVEATLQVRSKAVLPH